MWAFLPIADVARGPQDAGMKIAFLVFDKLTALDAIGPYEVLSRIPEVELRFVAQEPGEKRTDTGMLGITADAALDDLPDPDILLVPGGEGNRPLHGGRRGSRVAPRRPRGHRPGPPRSARARSCSRRPACSRAGGRPATGPTATSSPQFGAEPVAERVVVDGKVVTAAGVSAGHRHGAAPGRAGVAATRSPAAIQLGIEYDPEPPFDPGRPRRPTPARRAGPRRRLKTGRRSSGVIMPGRSVSEPRHTPGVENSRR